jgi:xylulokinase
VSVTGRRDTAAGGPLWLGIDIGTSGARAVLVDRRGRTAGAAGTRYGISEPRPGWAEQDPVDWWDAVGLCVRQALAEAGGTGEDVASVGITGQMHGLVLLDSAGTLLRPAIIWPDRRSEAQCRYAAAAIGDEVIQRRSGQPVAAGLFAVNLLWMRDEEPATYRMARWALLPKDYVRYRLTGTVATDPSDAAGTLLFDLAAGDWSSATVSALGLRASLLPPVRLSGSVAGRVRPTAARVTGLVPGTPVAVGAGDQAAAAISLGLGREGRYGIGISTGGTVLAGIGEPTIVPGQGLHTLPSAAPGRWLIMGAILSAGLSLDWLAHLFAGRTLESPVAAESIGRLVAQAAAVRPGAEGLLFLPYLRGERTPHLDPVARGSFVGLTTKHTQAMLARAVMDGVAFALAESVGLVAELAGAPGQCVCYGGGARGGEWCQMLADVLGIEVFNTPGTHHSARGAALLARSPRPSPDEDFGRAGAGAFSRHRPDDDAHRAYAKLREVYSGLYSALSGSFAALADILTAAPTSS